MMNPELIWAAFILSLPPTAMAGRKLRHAYDATRVRKREEDDSEDFRLTSWLGDLRPAESFIPDMAAVGVGRHRLRAEGLTNRHHRG